MTQTCTFMRGLSASGKSTLARELSAKTGAVRVNMDDIRSMLSLPFSKDAEKLALRVQDDAILGALRAGRDVIVDNTHLHGTWPRRVATLIWENNFNVQYQIVDTLATSFDECERRNNLRTTDRVPSDALVKQQRTLQSSIAKGLWTVKSIQAGLPQIVPVALDHLEVLSLPKAVIFDIDGTLAKHVARGPYDMELAGTDAVHYHISDLVDMYCLQGYQIILCSGRARKWRDITTEWMGKHNIHFDHLFMRPDGDERRDSVIKLELHDDYIRGQYRVDCVYDDRDRVVAIWRALGYPCLQVAPGDF